MTHLYHSGKETQICMGVPLRPLEMLKEWLPEMADRIAEIPDFKKPAIEAVLKRVLDEMAVKPGVLMNAVRTAVTGQPKGPAFFDFLLAIGQKEVVRRLRRAAELFPIEV